MEVLSPNPGSNALPEKGTVLRDLVSEQGLENPTEITIITYLKGNIMENKISDNNQ